jgi:spore coat polysaccharide biosynthesis protein SpsF
MELSTVNLGIIIQARMGSSRLPGKILRVIHDRTLLEHVLSRLSHLKHEAGVIVATTDSVKDDIVATFCADRKVNCFRGSESNVLERYFLCARHYAFTQIVRLTSDNPFTDIEALDQLIDLHLTSGADFSHSFRSLPVGVGAEIFTFDALAASYREGKGSHHIEHVDEYLLENPARFKTVELRILGPKNQPKIRLTVDTEDDYRRACYIAEHAGQDMVTTVDAIRLCLQFA